MHSTAIAGSAPPGSCMAERAVVMTPLRPTFPLRQDTQGTLRSSHAVRALQGYRRDPTTQQPLFIVEWADGISHRDVPLERFHPQDFPLWYTRQFVGCRVDAYVSFEDFQRARNQTATTGVSMGWTKRQVVSVHCLVGQTMFADLLIQEPVLWKGLIGLCLLLPGVRVSLQDLALLYDLDTFSLRPAVVQPHLLQSSARMLQAIAPKLPPKPIHTARFIEMVQALPTELHITSPEEMRRWLTSMVETRNLLPEVLKQVGSRDSIMLQRLLHTRFPVNVENAPPLELLCRVLTYLPEKHTSTADAFREALEKFRGGLLWACSDIRSHWDSVSSILMQLSVGADGV